MTYSKRTILAETDKFHVNNVQLLAYLDEARYPWYRFCQTCGVEGVLVHLDADFKKEVFDGDELTITTSLEKLGNTSFTLEQIMTNTAEDTIISANIVLATINKETRMKTPVPPQIRELFHSNQSL